ncbi:hypothetical protein NWF34_15685 [Gordonia sp. GONU]|uniref:hypothetical protein n=1 Tax=Gordonia sp. GONU TaxID=2972949 RepID=UPI0021AC4912|nr:hypothetical protein [Gordonia sp. GONU]MCR8898388.1 hypothetical protein [Gordonia sp. GONU]
MTAGVSPPAHAELDGMLDELAQGVATWTAMPLEERADLLLRTRTAVDKVSRRWAEVAIRIKSTPHRCVARSGCPVRTSSWPG